MAYSETTYQRERKLVDQLKQERLAKEDEWRDIADYMMPERAMLGGNFLSQAKRDTRKRVDILDDTAGKDMQTGAAGLQMGMTNASKEWFQLATPDEDLNEWGPAKRWLEENAKREANLFRSSNLYQTLPSFYMDVLGFGVASSMFLEDEDDVFRFRPLAIGTYCLASNAKGRLDTTVVDLAMTTRQMVNEYGYDRCSREVRNCWDQNHTEVLHHVVQLVLPNHEYDRSKMGGRFKAWRSCHFEVGVTDGTYLRESGFDENPLMAARWSADGQSPYGNGGPGRLILPDVKALQTLERRAAQGVDKAINPPLTASADQLTGAVDLRPGGITYYSNKTGTAPAVAPLYQVNVPLQYMDAKIAQKQNAIHRGLFADLFLMLTMDDRNSRATAAEIHARMEEKLLMLGPVFESVSDECLDPLVTRGFAMMARRGLLTPPPPELEGMPLNVRYVSVLAQAMKEQGLGAQERLVGHVGMLAGIHPEILDTIDWDKEVEVYADRVGASARIVRTAEERLAIRKQRAEAAQAAQAAEMAAQGAKAAKDLSGADMGGDSMLSRLTAQPALS